MTGPAAVRAAGRVCALAALVTAGSVLGGRWWLVALVGAVGALSGRSGSLVHAVATLALAGASADADATWLVPLLVGGTVASLETAALADRANRIRTSVPVGPALAAPLVAAASAASLLALATQAPPFAVPVALAGVLAAAALLAAALGT